MKPWTWLLFVGCFATFLYLCRPGASSPPVPLTEQATTPRLLGAGSCAAAACHNGNFAHGQARSEYTFWITRDPHARAYEVLFNERSKSIQKNLQRTISAHEEQRCLSCHVAPAYVETKPPEQAPQFKTDGVSCESCHGPASQWINEHHLDAWQTRKPAEKQRLGMNDTRSLAGRAQVCATCHVGMPGIEVDHDLIAAGHPRLHFELAAFHAHLPRHWPDAKDRAGVADFEERLWAVGQLATTHAALELLADRAGNKSKPWPEFAEFDCGACHHDLKSSREQPRPGFAKRKAGSLSWGPQAFASISLRQLLPDHKPLHDALSALRGKMDTGDLSREPIARDATQAARLLRPTLDSLLPAGPHGNKIALDLLESPRAARDEETQRLLAIAALTTSNRPAALQKSLGMLRISAYDPSAVQRVLLELRKP